MENINRSYHLIRLDTPVRLYIVSFKAVEHYHEVYVRRETPTFEVVFQQEGTVWEQRNETEIAYPPGSVRIMLINHDTVLYTKESEGCAFFRIEFRLDQPPLPLNDEDVAAWSISPDHAILPDCVTEPAVCERIGYLLKSAQRIVANHDRFAHLKLRTILHECLAVLSEHAVSAAQNHLQNINRFQSPYTKKALEFIEKNLSCSFTAADIHNYVGISYEHLHRCFRRDMNMTITEYVNRARIHRVEHFIVSSNMTLAEAGALVGIRDVKYLSRLFHRFVGVSAAEYRRLYGGRGMR